MTKPTHVHPLNDLRDHDVSSGELCPCMPLVWAFPGGAEKIVHTSYDKREVGEVVRRALRLYRRALSRLGHAFTAEEMSAEDHALHLLSIHWPEVSG